MFCSHWKQEVAFLKLRKQLQATPTPRTPSSHPPAKKENSILCDYLQCLILCQS